MFCVIWTKMEGFLFFSCFTLFECVQTISWRGVMLKGVCQFLGYFSWCCYYVCSYMEVLYSRVSSLSLYSSDHRPDFFHGCSWRNPRDKVLPALSFSSIDDLSGSCSFDLKNLKVFFSQPSVQFSFSLLSGIVGWWYDDVRWWLLVSQIDEF